MPRPRGTSVPISEADPILKEVLVRAEARRRASALKYDPELGDTPEEAHAAVQHMKLDINEYGKYVYGVEAQPFHRYWNKTVDDVIHRRVPQNKLLIIAPPNSGKSFWNTIIRATHYLGNNPNHHLIFITSSDDMAKAFDSSFASILEHNMKYRTIYPDKSNRPYKRRGWSSDGRYLYGISEGDKDPSYRAVGLNATIMGARANGIFLDDPLDQKNAQSEAMQRLARTYIDQTVIPRLQPNTGFLIATMTRFGQHDLGSHLISLAENSGDWLYIRTPLIAEQNDLLGRKEGELLWPERLDETFVRIERRRITSGEFNMIHQGNPEGMGGDVFKSEEWFRDLPENFWKEIYPSCKTIQAWDLAFSENKQACFTVCITIAMDTDFNMYILNVFRKRLTPVGTENVMVNAIRMAKPILIGIEESRFHQTLTRTIARNVMQRVMCNIRLITPDKDKTSRALLPAARAESGLVFVAKNTEWWRTFSLECLGFPNTKFKDQVDAFSLVTYLVTKLEELTQEEKPVIVTHVA